MTLPDEPRMDPANAHGTARAAWRHARAVIAQTTFRNANARRMVESNLELAYNAGWAQGYDDGTTEAVNMTREAYQKVRAGQ